MYKFNSKKGLTLLLALLMMFMLACRKEENNTPFVSIAPVPTITIEPTKNLIGGEIRLPIPVNADIADPLNVNTEEMLAFFSVIYEGVIAVNQDGTISPELAENWSCDESGRVWTFRMRSNAKWHDTNEPINASDVISTYNRILDMGSTSYYYSVVKNIESMKIGDDGTLDVTMKEPGMQALHSLTFPVMNGGMPDTSGKPIGTGPYMAYYFGKDYVRTKINTDWWKQPPIITQIVFYEKASNEIAITSFEAGQLDFVPTSLVSVGRYRDEESAVVDVMTQNIETMLFNFDNPWLKDVKIRKAFVYALDRSKIITNIYMNRAQMVDVPIAPDSWLYNPKSKVYDFNKQAALDLLAEAGWMDTDEDGVAENISSGEELAFSLLVNNSTDTTRKNAADLIALQLLEVGIKVDVVYANYEINKITESEYIDRLSSGDFDIALCGFNLAQNGDLSAYLSENGIRNYGKYSNEALVLLAQNILTGKTESEVRNASDTFQVRFIEELPFIPLYFRLHSILAAYELNGITSSRKPDIMLGVEKWFYIKTGD